ncbi:MAG: biotin/lipoyl-containing protein, partial [Burkholderiaceae bacterium]
MAIVEVKVPQLSESVAEATLMTWKKKPGDAVAMDEILIEVETDKVVLEVPAPAAGVMAELVEADGATVASEQVIARIDTDGVGVAAAPAAPAAAAAAAPASASASAPASSAASTSKAGVASPAAAKHMADNGMAAGSVAGTGKDGRVTKGDVLAAVAAPKGAVTSTASIPTGIPQTALQQVATLAPDLGDRPEQRVP